MITYTYKLQGDKKNSWNRDVDGVLDLILDITVNNWSLRSVLTADGLIGAVEAALAGLSEPDKTNANLAWNFSPTVNFNSPVVGIIIGSLDLTKEQATDIFQRAKNLEV